jgi:hypothetical protein
MAISAQGPLTVWHCVRCRYMLHAVLPSWSDGNERISIGFNVSPMW